MMRWSDRQIDRPVGVRAVGSSRIVDPPAGAIAAAASSVQVASVAAVAEEAGAGGAAALIGDLPDYADDAEAAAAGVPVGGLYRSGDRLVPRAVP